MVIYSPHGERLRIDTTSEIGPPIDGKPGFLTIHARHGTKTIYSLEYDFVGPLRVVTFLIVLSVLIQVV